MKGEGETGCCCPIRWTFLKYVPYQSHQERRGGECGRRAKNTALPPSPRPTRFKIDSTDNDVASEREQSQKNAFCSSQRKRGMPIIRPFYLPEKCSPSHSESLFTLFHYAEFCAGNEGEARPEQGGAATPLSGFRVPPLLVGRAIKSPDSPPPSPPACPELQYHVK